MQAGAMGLPSIVTDINGCNEIIIEDKNGVIIPTKDSVALFQSMELLISDTDLRNSLAISSRQMIIDRFAQDFVWSELLNEYNKLTKEIDV
jgi:glycosyltransferase involved in cell wall biosynthesis